MTFEEIVLLIKRSFEEGVIIETDETLLQPVITIATDRITDVCAFLHINEQTYFDQLSCLTGIDNGVEVGTMEVIYNLYSIPFDVRLTLKVVVQRSEDVLPKIPSVESVWKTADWHERETFDLFGIEFTNHPDLRRILLPANWEGYPLRKDYKEQETYHGITVKY